VIDAQQFHALVASGDVFIHGDAATLEWAYSCTALEALQVLPRNFAKSLYWV
jgi:hypothetical protein